MNSMELSPTARTYVDSVIAVGAVVILYSVHRLYVAPVEIQWFVLAGLTLLTGSFTIKVPTIRARASVSETFVFASVLLFGAEAGTVTVLLETLVISFWLKSSSRSPHRVLFSIAAPSIAIWTAGKVFFWFSQIEPYSKVATPLPSLLLPLIIFTSLYFLLNTWLVAAALGFEKNVSAFAIWRQNFTWISVNYFSGASVAALLVTYSGTIDFRTLAIIVPLLVISYLTFRTAMGRVEDANEHLAQLNRLYLSTIETLAMAIDAKDQITHGHIRRVQAYAVGLAGHLGVVDQALIKAIEAAALLHDMGKLAVPEYILNKPGKLTPAEFEKMKLHASIGADILSAIDFPYPVVPIVRHHHESWDGTGYPDKLKGTTIPIGARILSVVDCFDALTSDRPYRPSLPTDDALQILRDRRGSMYDPLIVDTFIRVHAVIAPAGLSPALTSNALAEITSSTHPAPLSESGQRPVGEAVLNLSGLNAALTATFSVVETCDIIARQVQPLIPSSLCVFFLYDEHTDELEAKYAVGTCALIAEGLRIPRGKKLSGWVAANRLTIVNSDPTLDFGASAQVSSVSLRSCLSTALVSDEHLVGVLSFYSSVPNGFTEDQGRLAELVGRQIAGDLRRASECPTAESRSSVWPTLSALKN
jgi:putative nucleotidyltransferase with HDIG domain